MLSGDWLRSGERCKRLWLVISVEGISVKGWVIIRLWSSSPHSNTCYLVFKKEQANARGRRPQGLLQPEVWMLALLYDIPTGFAAGTFLALN